MSRRGLAFLVLSAGLVVLGSAAATPQSEVATEATTGKSEKPFEIRLVKDDEPSRATRDQLLRLLETYDLFKWIRTREIQIDGGAIPHSHPVLTLSTRHVKDDELLLATFIHEQMHWLAVSKPEAMAAAVAELRKAFPELPVGYPDGASDEESSYRHLIVINLEYWGLREVLGELRARWVIEFWTHDHYRALYKLLLERGGEISQIQSRHGLWP